MHAQVLYLDYVHMCMWHGCGFLTRQTERSYLNPGRETKMASTCRNNEQHRITNLWWMWFFVRFLSSSSVVLGLWCKLPWKLLTFQRIQHFFFFFCLATDGDNKERDVSPLKKWKASKFLSSSVDLPPAFAKTADKHLLRVSKQINIWTICD